MHMVRSATTAVLMLAATPALAAGQPTSSPGQHDQHEMGSDHMMSAPGSTASIPAKSLFERLGGQPAINAVVEDFAGRALADPRINTKFARSDPARLVAMLKEFVCAATGGPCKYTGLGMKQSHRNMAVTDGEFGALVEDLVASLDKFKVPDQEKKDLLAALGPLQADIVEVKSKATGTELPKTFRPAPPLKSAAADPVQKPK